MSKLTKKELRIVLASLAYAKNSLDYMKRNEPKTYYEYTDWKELKADLDENDKIIVKKLATKVAKEKKMKYKIKHTIVEAFQFGIDDTPKWFESTHIRKAKIARRTDWVIREHSGLVHVCVDSYFRKEYEPE